MKLRCVNFDWLEVFCIEDTNYPARSPQWYEQQFGPGSVNVRAYGTPMYEQMFTISYSGVPILEVRRRPLSRLSEGGIFPDDCCHVRLVNRSCYYIDPVGIVIDFMQRCHLIFQSVKRCDLAYDFNRFDNGQDPANFLRSYFANRYAKINQVNFQDHGRDSWQTKESNSAKWGSPSSPISTKLYCKSLELARKGHDKPYIRAAWQACGLDLSLPVWRVEFAIQPNFKNLVKIDGEGQMPFDIMAIRTREQAFNIFFMLADRYFHFKYVETDADGKLRRKDRCRDKMLFRISRDCRGWKPLFDGEEAKKPLDKTLLRLVRELMALAENAKSYTDFQHIEATASLLIQQFDCDNFMKDWAYHEVERLSAPILEVKQPSFWEN